MERPSDTLDGMLIDEVASALKITAKQIRRLERRGALQFLDCRSWIATQGTRALVQRFVSGEMSSLMTRRRRAA